MYYTGRPFQFRDPTIREEKLHSSKQRQEMEKKVNKGKSRNGSTPYKNGRRLMVSCIRDAGERQRKSLALDQAVCKKHCMKRCDKMANLDKIPLASLGNPDGGF
jgi:hypothetical protein